MTAPQPVTESLAQLSLKSSNKNQWVNNDGDTLYLKGGIPTPHHFNETLPIFSALRATANDNLPIAVRHIGLTGSVLNFLIEFPPTIRPIFMSNNIREVTEGRANKDSRKYSLPFPWTNLFITCTYTFNPDYTFNTQLRTAFMYFTKKPLSTFSETECFFPPVPNILPNGNMCTGMYRSITGSLSNVIKNTSSSIFGYGFNTNAPLSSAITTAMKLLKVKYDLQKYAEQWSQISIDDILESDFLFKRKIVYPYKNIPAVKPDVYGTCYLPNKPNKPKVFKLQKSLGKLEDIKDKKDTDFYENSVLLLESAKSLSTLHPNPPVSKNIKKTTIVKTTTDISVHVAEAPNRTQYISSSYNINDNAREILAGHLSTGQDLLPPGLRYWVPESGVVAFERPPTFKKLTISKGNKNTALRQDLSSKSLIETFIPWTQYWVRYNTSYNITRLYVTMSSVPMDNNNTRLGICYLPNTYTTSAVCLPQALPNNKNIAEVMTNAYNAVWNTNFNADLSDGLYIFYNRIRLLIHDKKLPDISSQLKMVFKHPSPTAIKFFNDLSELENPHEILDIASLVSPPLSDDGCACDQCRTECECDLCDCRTEYGPCEGCECCCSSKVADIKSIGMLNHLVMGEPRSSLTANSLSQSPIAETARLFSLHSSKILH